MAARVFAALWVAGGVGFVAAMVVVGLRDTDAHDVFDFDAEAVTR